MPGPLEDWTRVTPPPPAQGSPSDAFLPEADLSVGRTETFLDVEPFGPPPRPEEVFPAAMFVVPDTAAEAETAVSAVMADLPPGHPSGPMPVVPAAELGVVAVPPPPPPPPPEPEPPRRRRTAAVLTTAAVVLAGGGGAAAYTVAHKTVTLDVDGEVRTVETFQGDVADLLTGEGVAVSGRDEVTPGLDAALRDGSTVVVRTAHELTLRADGERRRVWVAALDADQALTRLAGEGEGVALIPARGGGTASLPLPLDADGPVALEAGGEVREVADGAVTLDALLAAHDVRVDGDDLLVVEHRSESGAESGAEGGQEPVVTVVVRDVRSAIEETREEIPFETVTATDPGRYRDLGPYVASAGSAGERVTSWDVTRMDGRVVEREKLNTWVSRQPVDRVIMYGAKARPAPKPEKSEKSSGKASEKPTGAKDGAKGGTGKDGTGKDGKDGKDGKGGDDDPDPDGESRAEALSASAGVWSALAACESGGDPTTDTGNGYYGLYQFSPGTWAAMGGSGLPSEASAAEQTMRAQALQERAGWGPWPGCSAALGLS
ncbi:resuscitation-promoting factor [Promicromonospora citrea]|uniref:Resuscitation-promoting factor n=1 Tax=Promicromonospora citrea TaxID=43677 RepID=A0A8H9L519_9MICO|nr:resuscitation-promoting factor [Promicromonospora citrea]